jgi:F0F1-type ATP synthase membrane subunit b/b'
VDFTLKHALENGWEEFTVHQKKKDKATGEVIEEEIAMPASELHDGAHVYEGSVTAANPKGKQLIHKDAMSLSKQRKAEGHPSWDEFEASYEAPEIPDSETTSTTSSAKKVIKMTAAEKEAIAAAKKAEKEAEKAVKKAEKEAEKAAKKAEKEAEKAAKKAEKEAEKAAKKAEKEAAKKPSAKGPVPAAAVKSAIAAVKAAAVAPKPAAASAPIPVPVKAKKAVAAVAPAVEEWSCPADGMCHPWSFKGIKYARNSDNEVWLQKANGELDWQGVFLPAENRIDDSVPEPEYE